MVVIKLDGWLATAADEGAEHPFTLSVEVSGDEIRGAEIEDKRGLKLQFPVRFLEIVLGPRFERLREYVAAEAERERAFAEPQPDRDWKEAVGQ